MEPGDLVLSKAGRDKDAYCIVVSVLGDYCFICDGNMRKSDRPKKKKIKHVVETGFKSEFLRNRLNDGQRITNTELRNEISKIIDSLNPSAFPVE